MKKAKIRTYNQIMNLGNNNVGFNSSMKTLCGLEVEVEVMKDREPLKYYTVWYKGTPTPYTWTEDMFDYV